jgi:nitroimidazol reductase NimA-like FMN-containing flavoprotein (pyridoxamine 5'-phosphate oxidase superfamily)
MVYVVPITYVYDGQYLFGHTKEGLKVRMMRQNPHICFEVDAIENLTNWQCVILQGVYEELEGEESLYANRMLLNRITPLHAGETNLPTDRLASHHPVTAAHLDPVTFRISITAKSGRYEKR